MEVLNIKQEFDPDALEDGQLSSNCKNGLDSSDPLDSYLQEIKQEQIEICTDTNLIITSSDDISTNKESEYEIKPSFPSYTKHSLSPTALPNPSPVVQPSGSSSSPSQSWNKIRIVNINSLPCIKKQIKVFKETEGNVKTSNSNRGKSIWKGRADGKIRRFFNNVRSKMTGPDDKPIDTVNSIKSPKLPVLPTSKLLANVTKITAKSTLSKPKTKAANYIVLSKPNETSEFVDNIIHLPGELISSTDSSNLAPAANNCSISNEYDIRHQSNTVTEVQYKIEKIESLKQEDVTQLPLVVATKQKIKKKITKGFRIKNNKPECEALKEEYESSTKSHKNKLQVLPQKDLQESPMIIRTDKIISELPSTAVVTDSSASAAQDVPLKYSSTAINSDVSTSLNNGKEGGRNPTTKNTNYVGIPCNRLINVQEHLKNVYDESQVCKEERRILSFKMQAECIVNHTIGIVKIPETNLMKTDEGECVACSICSQTLDSKINLKKHILNYHNVCKICGKPFKTFLQLKCHMRLHSDRFKCKECYKRFVSPSALAIHCRIHSGAKPYKCLVCAKAFGYKTSLKLHERVHKGETPYHCTTCDKKFKYLSSHRLHERVHKGIKPFQCGYNQCKRRFSCRSDLKWHLRTHTGEKPFKCDQCDRAYPKRSRLTQHMRVHTGVKPFECAICNKEFYDLTRVKLHIKIHSDVKPFICSVCNKAFTFRGSLTMHLRTHTGEKPFKCEICEKAFASSPALKLHMRCHTKEKPYECIECGLKFSSSSHLIRHKRVHTGERPFGCPECHWKFAQLTNLKAHMRTHKGEKSFKCDQCDKAYTTKTGLKNHFRTHTNERPYKCQLCSKSFNYMKVLKGHLLVHAGIKPVECDECHKRFADKGHLKRHLSVHDKDKRHYRKSMKHRHKGIW